MPRRNSGIQKKQIKKFESPLSVRPANKSGSEQKLLLSAFHWPRQEIKGPGVGTIKLYGSVTCKTISVTIFSSIVPPWFKFFQQTRIMCYHRHISLKVPNIEFFLTLGFRHNALIGQLTETSKSNSMLGNHLHAIIRTHSKLGFDISAQ